ncbi:nuclease-related domain-containing protein [Salibacterium qingdaonense]|uniref:Nuclease-related domain-containing protein n=1 Tax=Salibacterium qingdaonense TaxID=266892 RepID=A0A1I4NZV8_9BACI|nr:nuclease-related domain-containing protein [Salibacterium qingdaonense]SFM21071.1 Nuclease-related domain-containing protein [Salibacterium qingdaonense]
MIHKPCAPSEELLRLRYLNRRMNLEPKDKLHYNHLEKGHEGEKKAGNWLKTIDRDAIILHDLLLEMNNSIFQIDFLVITWRTIYMFEVKNYDGNFILEENRWYILNGKEIKNPLLQLERTESLLRQLFQSHNWAVPIESYLLFMNPHFMLYQSPPDLPIIFPAQHQSFMETLNQPRPPLSPEQTQLAQELLTLHISSSPYRIMPEYSWDSLKKGIICPDCDTFVQFHNYNVWCPVCRQRSSLENTVLGSVKEFQLLFPDKRITTPLIYEWTGIQGDKQRIQRILAKHFNKQKQGRHTYYVQNKTSIPSL